MTVTEQAGGGTISDFNLEAKLGTELLPSYSYLGDLDTGIWSPAADTIAESTGGVERRRITDTDMTLAVDLVAKDGTATNPAIRGSDVDTGFRFAPGHVYTVVSGGDAFKVNGTVSGPAPNIASGTERRQAGFFAGAAITFTDTPLIQERVYQLFCTASTGTNNGVEGVYTIYKLSFSSRVIAIQNNSRVTVSVNGSDQVVVTSALGATPVTVTGILTLVSR